MKRCGKCGEDKPLAEFSQREGRQRDGSPSGIMYYQYACRECYNEARRGQKMRQVYGITVEQYEEMLARQDGGCAICGATPGLRSLAIDHDHETYVVRGLLCGSCNNGVGRFQDSPVLLRRAADYLETPVHTLTA